MTTARQIVTPDPTRLGPSKTVEAAAPLGPAPVADSGGRCGGVHALLTHRVVDDALLVRLEPRLSIRNRAAATLALEDVVAAYSLPHLVLEAPGIRTPAVLSAILRTSRACGKRGTVLSVVVPDASSRALLRDALDAASRVFGSTGEALMAVRRAVEVS
ncbi:hypothetical protein ACFXB3_15000 [Streptomyces sp. NPDC059447]|uniref:hypothetical protein n=1 Tax=Streptomyces sp. NPDC059447 TaxID=3346834 RepID=UPI00368FCB80